MKNEKTIGDKIYTLRVEKNLTQQQFAEKVGCSQRLVSNWEHNERTPRFQDIIGIAVEFSLSLDEFFKEELQQESQKKRGRQSKTKI